MKTISKPDQKPSSKKPRILNIKELTSIRKWVQKIQQALISEVNYHSDVVDLALNASPSEVLYGRYANPQESSPIIAEAARFVSAIATQFQQLDANLQSRLNGEFHKRLCQRLQNKVNNNEAEFFECVGLILRERRSGINPAQIDPRKMHKFAVSSRRRGRPPFQENTQKAAMEYATFKVLNLRCAQPGKRNPETTKAITRSEIKEALIGALNEEQVSVKHISDTDLSECLKLTPSGQFLKPFMAEQPIATRKSLRLRI
jgi:hypothetical protein